MTTSTDLMIEAADLRRSFGAKEAVAGISFSARRGEIFGLLGPNGAGKTTTIRMLTGQIDPSGGGARVAGCDVVKERAQLKARIGVVFEEQNLYERLSARLNLEFSCWLYEVLLLKDHADARFQLRALFDDIAARHAGAAAAGIDLAGEHANRRRFACAVGAEQAKDFAAPGTETNPSYRLFGAKAAAQISSLDHQVCTGRHTLLLIDLPA